MIWENTVIGARVSGFLRLVICKVLPDSMHGDLDHRPSPLESTVAARFAAKRPKTDYEGTAPLVTIDALADNIVYPIYGEVITGLRTFGPLKIEYIASLALRTGASGSLRNFVRARMRYGTARRRKWRNLYAVFCDSMAYWAGSWHAPLAELKYWRLAAQIWHNLSSSDELAAVEVSGILIGDLVIDTYLRLRPSPTLCLTDPYLLVVLRQAIKDIVSAERYFRYARPAAYMTFYTSYVHHGVPARVAVAQGIPVLALGNLQEFVTPITADHLNHTKRSGGYSHDFASLPDSESKIASARQALEARLSGHLDTSTAYMQTSAYSIRTDVVPDVRGAAVLFLHDFYDSAHIYSWMVFHDFWDWACTTIETLEAAGLPFFIKPHPNQALESNTEVIALKRKYPNLRFISVDITNRQLVDAGMACAITLYGSVASEVAFMGIPSISAGDNPHASFDAFHLARNKKHYCELLRSFPMLKSDSERLKVQSCVFYFMHNLNLNKDEAELRDTFVVLFANLLKTQRAASFDINELNRNLDSLTATAGFRQFAVDFLKNLKKTAPPQPAMRTEGIMECSQIPQS